MPVRGSSQWRHAVVEKKVINLDGGGWSGNGHVMCAWDTCERDGLEIHKVIKYLGKERGERTMSYVFCTERHRQYWLASIRPGNNNNLPPGYKRSIL